MNFYIYAESSKLHIFERMKKDEELRQKNRPKKLTYFYEFFQISGILRVAPICNKCSNPPFSTQRREYPSFRRLKTKPCAASVVSAAITIIDFPRAVIKFIAPAFEL